MMKRAMGASVAFHVAIVTVGYVGLPYIRDSLPPLETPIIVDIVEVGEKTNVPPKAPEPQPEPAKTPPPPAPAAVAPPPPPPPPQAAAEPAPKLEAPKPEPAPKAEVKPEPPKPEPPKAQPKPEPPKMAKPQAKPAPPQDFASVLKTLDKIKPTETKQEEAKPTKPAPAPQNLAELVNKAVATSKTTSFDPNQKVSVSEIDLVKSQIAQCWSLPAGAKEAGSLVTDIRVWMNPNGTVQKAEVQNSLKVNSDPYHRAMAESALRAVLNQRCQPFKLPPDKYAEWSTMTIGFDPKEMF
jgi:outer membrane biosynthesis protein TonB